MKNGKFTPEEREHWIGTAVGVVVGTGVGIGIDYGMLKIDEWQNREEYKADLEG